VLKQHLSRTANVRRWLAGPSRPPRHTAPPIAWPPQIFRVSLATREVGQIGAIDTEPSYRQNGRLRAVISAAEMYTGLNE
jgi:hypothetical protein